MRKIYLSLLMLIGLNTMMSGQDFYDVNTINTIEINFTESNWDAILDQYYAAGDEERLIGSVSINGQVFDSAGIRYKGNSTYSANQIKNPLNIKLDHIIDDQTIEGYGTLKLANVSKDPTFVREVLSYEIARKYFPASQSNYANVYINGTYLGFYTSDQSVDKFFMRTHFGSDENTRVKGELTSAGGPPSGGVWEYFNEDSASYSGYYDMKSDYGWDELIDFLDVLNNNNENIDESLNIDRHLWFLAFSNLLVNLDGPINNPQNYYLYKDDNGRFNPMPWDLNESFGVFGQHQTLGNLGTYQLQQFSPFANINESDFPIISKILTNENYKKIYVAHMKTIIEENFSNNLYESRALEIQDIIEDDVQGDPNKFYSFSDFSNNLYNSVGGGPQSTIGIIQLMDARVDYLTSLSDFQSTAPEITDVAHSPELVAANSEVWFTAQVNYATDVKLATRSNISDKFNKISMFDDGQHNDGDASDNIYGVVLTVGSTDIQYYIYSENDDAVAFSPVRAEYEFYDISVSGSLVINEFMADNESTVTDQDGDYDDWIELYNNGTEDINLNGYYLSDDATEPNQWAFPDTTILQGDYLIIWADKDEEQQGLHSNFKLSASGETLVLSDTDLNVLDEVNFLQQKADTSTGRYLNGTGDFIEMLPTFGAENTNLITGIDESLFNTKSMLELEQNYPNPTNGLTTIEFFLPKSDNISINLFNIYGKSITTLFSGFMPEGDHSITYQTNDLKGGIYIYTLSSAGQVKSKKMIVQ